MGLFLLNRLLMLSLFYGTTYAAQIWVHNQFIAMPKQTLDLNRISNGNRKPNLLLYDRILKILIGNEV